MIGHHVFSDTSVEPVDEDIEAHFATRVLARAPPLIFTWVQRSSRALVTQSTSNCVEVDVVEYSLQHPPLDPMIDLPREEMCAISTKLTVHFPFSAEVR